MATYKGTIKKWLSSSSVWDILYPQTTIDQVISLSTSLADIQSDIDDGSVFFIQGNTTGTAGSWTGSHTSITTLFTGLKIAYKIGINGASTTNLNINGYGNVLVRRNTGNLTTHLPIGTVVFLVFDGTYWVWADYDSDDVYTLRNSYNDKVGADPMYAYKIMIEGSDGLLYPLTLESGTGLTKTVSTRNLKIGGFIKGYVTSATVAANTVTRYYMAESVSMDGLYTFNSSSGFITGAPIYLVGIVQSDGSFKLDNSTLTAFYTQTLPTTDDGKIYIHLGIMHDTTRYVKIHASHPIYQFKNSKLRLYETEDPKPASNDVIGVSETITGSDTTKRVVNAVNLKGIIEAFIINKGPKYAGVVTQTTTSLTLTDSHVNNVIDVTHTSTMYFTITAGLTIGSQITIIRTGNTTLNVQVSRSGTELINGLASITFSGQYKAITLIKVSSTTWIKVGA